MTSEEFLNGLKDIIHHKTKNPNYLFIVEDTICLLARYENSLTWPKEVKWKGGS